MKMTFFEKVKDSVKAISFIYLLAVSLVLLIFGFITPGQWLAYTGGVAPAFWGIREYGKRYRIPYAPSDDLRWDYEEDDHDF